LGIHQIDVKFEYRADLTQIVLDISSCEGRELTGQDILDAVAETLLLKWDNYDPAEETDQKLDS
jgi:hypothetical protein